MESHFPASAKPIQYYNTDITLLQGSTADLAGLLPPHPSE